MDDYLLGVVPVEMSYLWPAEALKSQVVAARTYALKRLHPTIGRWDVYDDTRSQVYRGSKAERASVTAAVTATAGLVLRAGAAVANTPFHSAGGGATESNEFVWTRADGTVIAKPCPELRGSSDRAPDGSAYDAGSPAAAWRTATYSIEAFSAMMAADKRTNVGIVTAIDLTRRGVSGRLVAVTLIGTAATRTVSGSVFQSIFNARRPPGHALLRSTLIDLAPIP
jgi:stage II sporulation protein D